LKNDCDFPFSMPRGFLDMEILTLLERPMCGYEIMKYIQEHFGCWKPSPGSVYPMLKKMENDGFIKKSQEGRKKIYVITEKGKEHIRKFSEISEEIREKFMSMIRLVGDHAGSGMMRNFVQARYLMHDIGKNPLKKGKLNKIIIQYIKDLKKLAEE